MHLARRARGTGRTRGASLIFAVAILGLLALLAAAFATLIRVEMHAARNYREGERARYLAYSGLERGKYEVRRAVATPDYPIDWVCYDRYKYDTNAVLNQSTIPVFPSDIEKTRSPSLGRHYDTAPATLANPDLPWPSGFVDSADTYFVEKDGSGAAVFWGDYYTLRVTDNNSLINLNDSCNPNLARMITSLGEFLNESGAGIPSDIGYKILVGSNAAPSQLPWPRTFRRVEELKGLDLGGGAVLSDDAYRALAPFLTCSARIDSKVVEMGNQNLAIGSGSLVASRLRMQPRSPINVNLAPKAVLVAALKGIAGPGASIDLTTAKNLAAAIINYRKGPQSFDAHVGFTTWGEFAAFLATAGLSNAQQDAVMANANPNTDINRFVPDLCIYRTIDKSMLTGGTTELCFGTGGMFTIESVGTVLDRDGKLAAQARVRTVIKAFDQHVDTTQVDFESDREAEKRPDNSPSATPQGLRDITSLPEVRNNMAVNYGGPEAEKASSGGVVANLHAAPWDGQLTFNVITRAPLSDDSVYVGFIDRSFDAQKAPGGTANVVGGGSRVIDTPVGDAKGEVLLDPVNNSYASGDPNGASGSDLHPMGIFTGRSSRQLDYRMRDAMVAKTHQVQEVDITLHTHQDVKQTVTNPNAFPIAVGLANGSTVIVPGRSTVGPLVIATIDVTQPGHIDRWSYDSIDKQGFEMWFKPAKPATGTQILFDWHSDPPQLSAQPVSDQFTATTTVGSSSFVAGTYQSALSAGMNQAGQITTNVRWGAEASFQAKLIGTTFHAEFRIKAKNEGETPPPAMSGSYTRIWEVPNITPGTWHHWAFNFWVPEGTEDKKKTTECFVDGRSAPITTGAGASWPTERDAQARVMKRLVDEMIQAMNAFIAAEFAASTIGNNTLVQGSTTGQNGAGTQGIGGGLTGFQGSFPIDSYRVPVRIPMGGSGRKVCVAGRDAAKCTGTNDHSSGGSPFLGVCDNVIFQNNWTRPSPETEPWASTEYYIPRYDSYRPSTGDAGGNQPLVFRKRARAVEFMKPVRIVAMDMTAWKSVKVSGAEKPIDLGEAEVRFGWQTIASGGGLESPALTGTYNAYDSQGWTDKLTVAGGAAFNPVASGYLVQPNVQREPVGGGFLTRGMPPSALPEAYFYCIEITPASPSMNPGDSTGPRMAPVVDDVTITYMPWDGCTVLQEDSIDD